MEITFLITRSMEIMTSIIVGCFLCWMGYRLFFIGIQESADLKIEYGKTRIQLFRASPGIFFSILGSAIVVSTVLNTATYEVNEILPDGTHSQRTLEKGKQFEYPTSHETQFTQALNYQDKRDFDNATKIYMEMLRSTQLVGDVSNNLADVYKEQGNIEKALIFSRFATSVFPESSIFNNTLKQVEARRNQ